MCLYHVQTWLGAPWSGPYAEWSWHKWGGQHPGDKNPPPGVPVYWHNPRSKYGHIALSVGGGRVRTTDFPRGHVSEHSIDYVTRAWGLRYLGWSSRIGGRSIPGIRSSAPSRSHGSGHHVYVNKLHYGQKNSDSVKEMQRRLIKLGFRIPAGVTGNYFGQTDRAVRAWQRHIGDRPDRAGHSSIGPRQAARLFRGAGVTIHP
jgi:hypothetical protein